MQRSPVDRETENPSRIRVLVKSNAFRAGIVVVSAAIIFGAWAFSDYTRDDPEDSDQITLLIEDDLYEQARKAAESGETTAAVALLERVLAEEPDHEAASRLLRQLRAEQAAQASSGGAGSSGSTDPASNGGGSGITNPGDQQDGQPGAGTPPTDTPRDDSPYLVAASDLRTMLPDVITGWTRGTRVADDTDATVPFDPASPQAVSRVIYSVHDRGSADAALAFVENTSKVVFTTAGAPVRVGVLDGYFGTDGNRLATVAFARGRFAFEVVVVVPDGDIAAVRADAITLAQEFEATK